MSAEPFPEFLRDLVSLVAGKFGIRAPALLPSPNVRDVASRPGERTVVVNVVWLAGTLERFRADPEVGFAVVAGHFGREIARLAPNGEFLLPEALAGSSGVVLGLMGVSRDVFDRALPALASLEENDPKGLERARLIQEGYDEAVADEGGRRPKATRKPRPRRSR